MKTAHNGGRLKSGRRRERNQLAATAKEATPVVLWLAPLLVVLVTCAVLLLSLQNGFVDFDDDNLLLRNPYYRSLGWAQLRWMFSTFHLGHYQPLSWVTFGLDYLLWGMDPFGYHLTNLILHAINALFFYFVALRLLSLSMTEWSADSALRVGAGFAALLFAIHPLRVESVAWVTERRDVLSGLFFLAAIICYLRAAGVLGNDDKRRWWLVGAVAVYGLSLLSKGSGMTLPVVLVVMDVYPLRRLGGSEGKWFGPAARRVWLEKVPFLLLAVASAVIAAKAQSQAGTMKSLAEYGVVSRLTQALFGLAFYLWKTVWPVGLSPLYELPDRLRPWEWPYVVSGLMVLVISVVLFVVRERRPAGLAVWVSYAAMVAPVSGIAQSGIQIAADRYSYLSCLGWAMLAGGSVVYFWRRWRRGNVLVLAAGGMLVGGLGFLTWTQTQIWHDTESLWRHALTVTPESSVANFNLGYFLDARGRSVEAIKQYQLAVKYNRDYWAAHYNLAQDLAERGRFTEAARHYRETIRINPEFAEAYDQLGKALVAQGEIEEAILNYRQAVRINPRFADALYNLGVILSQRGDLDAALNHLQAALAVDPVSAIGHVALGKALTRRGDLDRAIGQFEEALRIRPEFAEAHQGVGQALAQQGKKEEAIKHYQEAARIMKRQPQDKEKPRDPAGS